MMTPKLEQQISQELKNLNVAYMAGKYNKQVYRQLRTALLQRCISSECFAESEDTVTEFFTENSSEPPNPGEAAAQQLAGGESLFGWYIAAAGLGLLLFVLLALLLAS